MARTISEIYNAIIAEKQTSAELTALQPAIDDTQTLLSDLSTTSKVAIWRLYSFIMAVAIHYHEVVFDLFKAEIEARAEEIPKLTARWYRDQALAFQFGDSLTYDGVKFKYDPINTANQIIKRAVAIDAGGQVRIKVAKLNTSTLKPEALTAPELTAAADYINEIKGAGVNVAVTSANPDDLKIDLFIRYNPQILTNTGALVDDLTTFPVIDAAEGYIENIPFNGVFNETEFIDAIQAAQGVEDAVLNSSSAKFGALAYSVIDKNYIPDAGHLALDLPSSTLTFTTETTF